MMRILLASGEEAVYRTVDELAMGISSGTITADARFFDLPSQDWRAIDGHPEYHEALARAAAIAPGFELESHPVASAMAPVVPSIRPERRSGSLQIYQMFSLSAAELQARKRPAWLLPGLAVLAAIVLLVSLTVALRGRGGSARGEEVESLAVSAVPVSGPRLPAPSSVEAMRLAPMNLNSHLTFAVEAAGRRLSDSIDAIGARGLLTRGRLLSADSVRRTREILVAMRSLISSYRASQRNAQQAYRDTAAMLVKSGFWSKIDQQEWRVYPPVSESPQDAAQADSLLDQLGELYDLLEEQPHAYREVEGRIQFDDPASNLQYERLRAVLSRHEISQEGIPGRPTSLSVLRKATSDNRGTARPTRYPLP